MAEATKPEETKNRARKGRSKPDLATLGGMVVALGGLLGGLLVEGGKIRDVSQFTAAMDDDFNTPRALAALFDLGAVANRQRDTADQASTEGSQASGTAAVEDLVRAGNVLWLLAGVLGLSGRGTEPNRQIKAVQDLVAAREAARRRRDWQLADQLRTRLLH